MYCYFNILYMEFGANHTVTLVFTDKFFLTEKSDQSQMSYITKAPGGSETAPVGDVYITHAQVVLLTCILRLLLKTKETGHVLCQF